MAKKNIPAISVVIPMYNAEKYIAECLDSILAQTFQDFEVIVVDDCSTDNSASIVESYEKKFKGKLQLVRLKVNSGSGAKPRTLGMRLARGEYIFFMDNDDVIFSHSLDEMYHSAEKFQADVVHYDKMYINHNETITTDTKKLTLSTNPKINYVTEPTLLSDNLAERLQKFLASQMRWEPWSNLVRREFILKNNLEFPNLAVADDLVFFFYILCLAEKFLLLPNAIYVYRVREDSTEKKSRASVENRIHQRAGDIFKEIVLLDEFTNQVEFFKSQPQFKFAVFEFFTNLGGIVPVIELYSKIPAFQLNALVRRELESVSDKTTLAAFFFSRMNILHVNISQQQNVIRQLQAQIQQLQAQSPSSRPPIQQPQTPIQLNQQKIMEFRINTEDIFQR